MSDSDIIERYKPALAAGEAWMVLQPDPPPIMHLSEWQAHVCAWAMNVLTSGFELTASGLESSDYAVVEVYDGPRG